MATVPSVKEPSVAPRPAPTVFEDPSSATPEAFGAGVARAKFQKSQALVAKGERAIAAQKEVGRSRQKLGRAMAQAGESVLAIGEKIGLNAANAAANAAARITDKRNTLDRMRLDESYDDGLEDMFIEEQEKGSNFVAEGSMESFNVRSRQLLSQIEQQHTGGPESRLILLGQLETTLDKFQDRAEAAGEAALLAEDARLYAGFVAKNTQDVRNTPGIIDNVIADTEALLGQMAATDTPEETEVKRAMARGSYALAAFDTLVALDLRDDAQKILDEFAGDIPPEKMRAAGTRLIVAEVEQAKTDAKRAATFARIKS